MAITVSCPCGASLRVSDEAGGKKARCPECGAVTPIPIEEQVLDGIPVAQPSPRSRSTRGRHRLRHRPFSPVRGAAARRSAVAWEVWIVLALLGLAILRNVVALARVGAIDSTYVAGAQTGTIIATLLLVLMFLGILTRSNWGWWLTVVVCAIILFFLALGAAYAPVLTPLLLLVGLIYVGIIGLLVLCRVRGAYD